MLKKLKEITTLKGLDRLKDEWLKANNPKLAVPCFVCGKKFKRKGYSGMYCSKNCRKIALALRQKLRIGFLNPQKYDWVLDMSKPMSEWKWKKIVNQ